MDALLREFELTDIPLIKLDIEGAEIEVILSMMDKKIFPNQILVEYDELTALDKSSGLRIESAHSALLNAGYRLINYDYPNNFLYIS